MSGVENCKWCGVLTDKICSHFNGIGQPIYFCCIQHKKLWEEYNVKETSSKTVLPKVRVLIGHKQKDGTISIVPGKGEIPK